MPADAKSAQVKSGEPALDRREGGREAPQGVPRKKAVHSDAAKGRPEPLRQHRQRSRGAAEKGRGEKRGRAQALANEQPRFARRGIQVAVRCSILLEHPWLDGG